MENNPDYERIGTKQDVEKILIQGWASIVDGAATLNQHLVKRPVCFQTLAFCWVVVLAATVFIIYIIGFLVAS